MDSKNYTILIRSVGASLIKKYIDTSHVETGINGPYDDPETEVRYLAHLIIIASIEFLKFGKMGYKTVVETMGDALLKMKQKDGTYKMRQKKGKDECNGVIGHAWLVEGLLYAYRVTGNLKYLVESERIFLMHEFNYKIGLWGRPLKGSDDKTIDYTFNHELWYAATLCEYLMFGNNIELKNQLNVFFEKLPDLITINKDGRIAHRIYNRLSCKNEIKNKLTRLFDVLTEVGSKPGVKYKEIGYHLFNLMAFARICRIYPEIGFFKSSRFIKTLQYISHPNFIQELEKSNLQMDGTTHGSSLTQDESSINIYGYPYNVPGFEVMYSQSVFGNNIPLTTAETLLNKQFSFTWNDSICKFGKLCHDSVCINSRIYEYYRYLEITEEC